MKSFFIILFIVGGTYYWYNHTAENSPRKNALAAYEKFEDARLNWKIEDAEAYVIEDSAADEAIGTRNAELRALIRRGDERTREMLMWATREVNRFNISADAKEITFQITEDARLGFQISKTGPATHRFIHTVSMVNTDDGWLLDGFEERGGKLDTD